MKEKSELVVKCHIILNVVFGVVGAYFSRMISFQSVVATVDYDSVEQDFSPWSLIVRLLTGAIGAVIFFLIVQSGLVGGEILPKPLPADVDLIAQKANSSVIFPSSELAKWLVWSILAGFSERLVPDQLDQIGKNLKPK